MVAKTGMPKVAVKFCGNCNPQISGGEIFQDIKAKTAAICKEVEFVSWESPDADVLVVISGCSVDCATRPQGSPQKIVVAGEYVNNVLCDIDQISTRVINHLQLLLCGRKE
jgi:hypothetical protein